MLQSIKQLCGSKLGALDGEIGQVKDFYFDDQNWAVRYVVADTGSWLPVRQVLISPHAFGSLHQAGKLLLVNLTRKQIENSPEIESHKPVSRQYEEEYYRYYGWPFYWVGGGMWGMSGFPILESPAIPLPSEEAVASNRDHDRADAHLRSTLAVNGYHIEATDGAAGHVCDFMMDAQSWAIRQLVIKTGHLFSGNEVQMPVSEVDRISYEESTVFASLTRAAIEQGCAQHPAPAGAATLTGPATPLLMKHDQILQGQNQKPASVPVQTGCKVAAAPSVVEAEEGIAGVELDQSRQAARAAARVS